jgi:hypothetical protein
VLISVCARKEWSERPIQPQTVEGPRIRELETPLLLEEPSPTPQLPMNRRFLLTAVAAALLSCVCCAASQNARLTTIVEDGFAGTSVNVIAGLQNNLVTHRDHQYAAFYDASGRVVLAKRSRSSSEWEIKRTEFTGNVADAHNTIAIELDGEGFLHIAWDHHGHPLNYARSKAPHSLELGEKQSMTGQREKQVTYPAFLRMPSGDLLFLYRDGVSGRGDLVLNRYELATRRWSQVHGSLIDGEKKRSAYISTAIDPRGRLHLTWVWRETPDVATNHDICYARSDDGGKTWTKSDGSPVPIPITAATAEYALRIPERSSLMNPPAIAADEKGTPYIANYWAPAGSDVPQYHLVYLTTEGWKVQQITDRKTPFVLAGTSTKRPPISRSILVTRHSAQGREVYLVFRDGERGDRVVAYGSSNLEAATWLPSELTTDSVGSWEPSFDPIAWRSHGELHLLVQNVTQRDGDDRNAEKVPPTPVRVLSWSP